MKLTVSKVLNIVLVTLLVTVIFFSTATSESGTNGYDPWVDYDESGNVDHMDLYQFAQSYGESGDPTKNVNVTNFPLDEEGNLKSKIIHSCYEVHKWFLLPAVFPPYVVSYNYTTAGYKEVFLYVAVYGTGTVRVRIAFNMAHSVAPGMVWDFPGRVDCFDVTSSGNEAWSGWKTYSVWGSRLTVELENPSDVNEADFEFYMYVTT